MGRSCSFNPSAIRCLIEVFKNYEVDTLVASSLDSSSQEYKVLKGAVNASQARIVNPKEGTDPCIGLIYLDILFPSQEFQTAEGISYEENMLEILTTKQEPNDFSVVAILSLGEFDALLTGDMGPEIAKDIINLGQVRDVDYIKVPHHGSKNGLTSELLEAAQMEVAVISVGETNSFGHPHNEIISLLEEFGVKTKRTDIDGEVGIVTDGRNWWFD